MDGVVVMGDFRANVKIEIELYGVKDKCDMYINWSDIGSPAEGVDLRVIEFFQTVNDRAVQKRSSELEDYYEDLERQERSEYERLKQKFG